MTPIDAHLLDLAEQADVKIEYTRLRDGRDGEYIHSRRLIRLRPNMHARLHRSVLAHELGHAAFGDVPSRFGPVHAKQERRADEWAALLLIDLDAYRQAEATHNAHPGAMAVELGTMRSTVEAYRTVLQRIGDHVYLSPRMGAGQWAHRELLAR